MKIKHSLAVVVSLTWLGLFGCYDVLITTRRDSYYGGNNLININFTLQQFKVFYKCLCKVTTQQCSVQVEWSYSWNTYIPVSNPTEVDQKHHNDDLACKHYQCHYSWSSFSFVCAHEASVSCQSSPRTRSIRYKDAGCSGVSCVGITWEFPSEELDYSGVQDKVESCNSDCECSAGVVATPAMNSTVRTTLLSPVNSNGRATTTRIRTMKRTKTTKPKATTTTKTTAKLKTTITTTKTTTAELRTPTRTEQTTVSMTPSQDITSQQVNPTTERNTTALGPITDTQTQNDPVPIIVGVVVAAVVVAFIAAVFVILWKRRSGKTQTTDSDCHEYANLPEASLVARKSDATTKVVDSNQDPTSQYLDYGTVNGSFDYGQGEVKYDSSANQTYGNMVAKVHADNQHYVNYEPNRSHTVSPVDDNQTKDTNLKNKDGYVAVTNTLEETDDFTTSIYSLAVDNDPEHLADVSGSNTEINFSNHHPQNSTNHPHNNATAAIATVTSHPFKETDIKNDSGYFMGKTHDLAKPIVGLRSVDKAIKPRQDYEFAQQTDGTISNDDYGYSLSNYDSNPESTYSIASNPLNNMDKTTASHPHVYSKLGEDNQTMVNPYDALQEVNEALVNNQANPMNKDTIIASQPDVYSKLGEDNQTMVNPYNALKKVNGNHVNSQAHTKQINYGQLPDQMDLYSVAEPVLEDPPQEDNDYSCRGIDSGAHDDEYVNTLSTDEERAVGDVHQLNNHSSCQRSHDNIYFELEK